MKPFTQFILAICLLANSLNVNGQQFLGNRISNFTSADALQLNPAASAISAVSFDIKILSAGAYVYNEYGYIINESILSALGKNNAVFVDSITKYGNTVDAAQNQTGFSKSLFYDFANIQKPFNNVVQIEIGGPSFSGRIGNFGFGMFTNFKANFNSLNADKILNYDTLSELNHKQVYPIGAMNVVSGAYSEIGLNFSHAFKTEREHKISLGINAKLLLGHEAVYIDNKTPTTFYKNRDSLWVQGGDIELGFATGYDLNKNYKAGIQGLGFAFDLGMSYLFPSNDNQKPYSVKLGVSLLDIGFINFNKNAEAHALQFTDVRDFLNNAYKGNTAQVSMARTISYQGFDDSMYTLQSNSFRIGSPTSLHIQADFNVVRNVFINVNFTRRISLMARQFQRSNSIILTPRVEYKWFEVGTPLSLIEDQLFGLGMYMRFGPLTVGSEQLNAWLIKQSTLQSGDVYLSLRVFPFKTKKTAHSRTNGRSKTNDYGCYKF
ncbi:MAG: hypothetical protein KA797_05745 [Chitinophagales bacterium]|nr:hypothetical protein [Chitinophagales bacterium]